jgi:hypothetical protein
MERPGDRSRGIPELPGLGHELLRRTAGLPYVKVGFLSGRCLAWAEEKFGLSRPVGSPEVELDEGRRREVCAPRSRHSAEAADGLGRQVREDLHDDCVLRQGALIFVRHTADKPAGGFALDQCVYVNRSILKRRSIHHKKCELQRLELQAFNAQH